MTIKRVDPLGHAPIAEQDGKPTRFFARQWQNLIDLVGSVITLDKEAQSAAQRIAELENAEIQAGTGLNGGGQLKNAPIQLSANTQAILNQISTTRGSILYRGVSAWAALGPGTAGNFLQTQGAGADPLWAAAGGGGSAWTLVEARTISSPTADEVFINLGAYSDIMVNIFNVTLSASGGRQVHVSTDNGSSFFDTSGDYVIVNSDGTLTNTPWALIHRGSSANARTLTGIIHGVNISDAPKLAQPIGFNTGNNALHVTLFTADDANPVNAIRVSGTAGNLTGGTIYVFGR